MQIFFLFYSVLNLYEPCNRPYVGYYPAIVFLKKGTKVGKCNYFINQSDFDYAQSDSVVV